MLLQKSNKTVSATYESLEFVKQYLKQNQNAIFYKAHFIFITVLTLIDNIN
jgi:hypothetical protein